MFNLHDENGYAQGFAPSPALTERNKRRAKDIVKEINKFPVLEIGCGIGEVTNFIHKELGARPLEAIDVSPGFIKAAKEFCGNGVTFYCSSFEGFVPPHQYGAVVGNGILHHFLNLDESLVKIRELLVPGGKAIFWEPNILNPYVFTIFRIPFIRKYTHLEPQERAFFRRKIIRQLTEAGFANIQISYRDFLIPFTPRPLIKLLSTAGTIAEHIPAGRLISQSLFIVATKNDN